MNIIFTLITLLSFSLLCIKNPNAILEVFSTASKKALELSFTLICVYAVWLGIIKILQETKLSEKISKLLKPIISKLIKTKDEETLNNLSLCFASNLLGIGGVATPLAIDSMQLLENKNNEYGKTMLFVISATSIQIIPISVLQLLRELGSNNPYVIFIPTLIATIFSTLIGIILVKVFA